MDATITAHDFTLHHWTVDTIFRDDESVNVNETSIDLLTPYFSRYCYETAPKLWNHPYDAIYIEQQPVGMGRSFGSPRNLKTKILSHILQHVLCDPSLPQKGPILFISPMLKLKDCTVPFKERSYKLNKKYAVDTTATFLGPDGHPQFHGAKKDDLADCFLQGLYAARAMLNGSMDVSLPAKKAIKKKKTTPKAPPKKAKKPTADAVTATSLSPSIKKPRKKSTAKDHASLVSALPDV